MINVFTDVIFLCKLGNFEGNSNCLLALLICDVTFAGLSGQRRNIWQMLAINPYCLRQEMFWAERLDRYLHDCLPLFELLSCTVFIICSFYDFVLH